MKIAVYNQKGEESGTAQLPKEIFEVEMNQNLVHQVITTLSSNKRQRIAHTKNRGEVSGGGKKPWRQKGTGRARHGSNRSPIWIGGGTTFGPRNERNFKKVLPKKMRRKALFMILSEKLKDKEITVLDKIAIKDIRTKEMNEILTRLPLEKGSNLIVLPEADKNIILSSRNIRKTATVQAKDINCLQILTYKNFILLKDSIKVLKDTFLVSKD